MSDDESTPKPEADGAADTSAEASADAAMDGRLRRGGRDLRASIGAQPGPLAAGRATDTGDASVDPGDDGPAVAVAGARSPQWRTVALGAAAAAVVAAVLASVLTYQVVDRPAVEVAAGPEVTDELAAFLDGLPDEPVDPHSVELVASVSEFDSCGALLDRLRRVGAEHVGSRGFGSLGYGYPVGLGDRAKATFDEAGGATASSAGPAGPIPSNAGPGDAGTGDTGGAGDAGDGDTIGTTIQVAGVDEPDVVKAVGTLVYSLRGDRLRITDTDSRSVLSVTDLDQGDQKRRRAGTSELLVSDTTAVVLGSESLMSEPVAGDPSASVSVEEYLTITQVDVSDPAQPTVADRSRVEGHLVAARLMGDQVRLVTGWSMSDIGFLVPTSPASVPVALDTNRRTLAASQVSDWIPEWDSGGEATPVSSCEDVYLPDTFAGVSMTSMINSPRTARSPPREHRCWRPATWCTRPRRRW